jgi:Ni2+-binding GTPase involved in maturation of urease and hydrogenase
MAGVPLPEVYPSLTRAEAHICRSAVTLVVGPPSAGKSLLCQNLLAKGGIPALAFLLDTNELTASARFAAILTGENFLRIKTRIIDGESDKYRERMLDEIPMVQVSFHAPGADNVALEIDAFEQRFGLPPDAVLIDNLGNQAGQFDGEWAVLKALTLEYDALAKEHQCAIIATAHTTDLNSCEPAQRTAILGKISQYPRLILSVGFDPDTGAYRVAVVKNTEGPTDVRAERPLTFFADPARMLIVDPLAPKPPDPGQGAWDF